MSDNNRIPSDRDDEWRESDAQPEDLAQLREKPALRLISPTDAADPSGDVEEDDIY